MLYIIHTILFIRNIIHTTLLKKRPWNINIKKFILSLWEHS